MFLGERPRGPEERSQRTFARGRSHSPTTSASKKNQREATYIPGQEVAGDVAPHRAAGGPRGVGLGEVAGHLVEEEAERLRRLRSPLGDSLCGHQLFLLALAASYFVGFGSSYFYWLWPLLVLLALDPIYIKGQPGPNNHIL